MIKSTLLVIVIAVFLNGHAYQVFAQAEGSGINDSINALIQEHLLKKENPSLVVFDPQSKEFKILAGDSASGSDQQLEKAKQYLFKGIRENLSRMTDEAVKSLELAYENAPDNDEITAKILENLTYTYNLLGKYGESVKTGKKALLFALDNRKPIINMQISDAYLQLNEKDSALMSAEQGLDISQVIKDTAAEVYSLTQIGKVHYFIGNKRIGGNYYKRAGQLANQHGKAESLSIANYYLSLYYDIKGRASKSMNYMKSYLVNRDSLLLSPAPSIDWLLNSPQNVEWDYQKINSSYKRKRIISALLFSLFILSGLGFILYREKVKRRELVLLGKISRLQINPHFILNSMNSLQRTILENETDRSNEFLSLFSRIIRFIFTSSFENYVPLGQEIKFLKDYTSLEKIRYKNNLNFSFIVEEDLDTKNILIPAMLIQPFIENSIWHGVLPKGQPGTITLTWSQCADDSLVCTIEDDGIGRKEAKKLIDDSVNQGNTHSTKLIRDRLEQFSKLEKKRFNFHYEDLINEFGDIAGTKVILQIPFKWKP